MKPIPFKSYGKFRDMKFKPAPNADEILYYSRVYGQRDWGFCISAFFGVDLDRSGSKANYIQAQFLTHDIMFASGYGDIIANPKTKVMTLKGLNRRNYDIACKWIEEQRTALFNSVNTLSGAENPLIELEAQVEILDSKVVAND